MLKNFNANTFSLMFWWYDNILNIKIYISITYDSTYTDKFFIQSAPQIQMELAAILPSRDPATQKFAWLC